MRKRVQRPKNGKAQREFSVVIEQDADGWYVGSVPELRGCHTQARSLDVLMTRIREAIEVCLAASKTPGRSTFVGLQRISV